MCRFFSGGGGSLCQDGEFSTLVSPPNHETLQRQHKSGASGVGTWRGWKCARDVSNRRPAARWNPKVEV